MTIKVVLMVGIDKENYAWLFEKVPKNPKPHNVINAINYLDSQNTYMLDVKLQNLSCDLNTMKHMEVVS